MLQISAYLRHSYMKTSERQLLRMINIIEMIDVMDVDVNSICPRHMAVPIPISHLISQGAMSFALMLTYLYQHINLTISGGTQVNYFVAKSLIFKIILMLLS